MIRDAGASASEAASRVDGEPRDSSPPPAPSSPGKNSGGVQPDGAAARALNPSPASMGARSGEGDFIGRAHQAPSPHAQAGESSAAKEQDADKGEQEQEKGANDARGTPSGMQVGAASAGGQGEETSSDMPKSEGAQCAAPEKNASAEEGPPGGMSSAVDATASTPVQDSVQESTLSSGSRTPVLTAAADPAGCRSSSDSPIPPPPPDDDACAPVAGLPAQAPAAAASGAGSQTSAMPASTAADAPPVSDAARPCESPAFASEQHFLQHSGGAMSHAVDEDDAWRWRAAARVSWCSVCLQPKASACTCRSQKVTGNEMLHMHIQMHMRTWHTCTHAHMHTCTHAHMHTHTHNHLHAYIHTYIHTYTRAHRLKHTPITWLTGAVRGRTMRSCQKRQWHTRFSAQRRGRGSCERMTAHILKSTLYSSVIQ